MPTKECLYCEHTNPLTYYSCAGCGKALTPHQLDPSPRWSKKSRENLCGWLFVISFVPFVFQALVLENTIGGTNLFFYSLAFGGAIGSLVTYFLLTKRIFKTNKETKARHFLFFFILCFSFLTATVTSSLNAYIPSSKPFEKAVMITGKCATRGRTGPSYFLLFLNGTAEERVLVSESLYRSLQTGETITFKLRSGFLGFPVIDAVEHSSS